MQAPDGTMMSNDKNKKSITLDQMILNYVFKIKLPKLLSFLDKSGGAFGLETRFPFLDHNLVEFCFSNPANYKISNGQTKANLTSFLNQRKINKLFVVTPQREFIKKNYFEILEYIKGGYLENKNLINLKSFENELISYSKNKSLGNSFFAWKVLNLEIFFKKLDNYL